MTPAARWLRVLHIARGVFSKATAVVREVCSGWQAVHDAMVMRLVFEEVMNEERNGATCSYQRAFAGGGVDGARQHQHDACVHLV